MYTGYVCVRVNRNQLQKILQIKNHNGKNRKTKDFFSWFNDEVELFLKVKHEYNV